MEIIDANKVIIDFISEMKYLENNHVLGCYFYGSYLTGLNHRNSDIDLHIVFDDYDSEHLVRGVKYKSGIKIEYFEKPISDLYLSIDNGYNSRNAAWLSIIGTSRIIFDKTIGTAKRGIVKLYHLLQLCHHLLESPSYKGVLRWW